MSVGGGGWLCWAVTSRPVRRHYLPIDGPLGPLLCALIRWVPVWAGCPHRHLSGLDALMRSGQTPRQAAEWLPGSWVPLGLVARETWRLASFEASGQMLARTLRAVVWARLLVRWCCGWDSRWGSVNRVQQSCSTSARCPPGVLCSGWLWWGVSRFASSAFVLVYWGAAPDP